MRQSHTLDQSTIARKKRLTVSTVLIFTLIPVLIILGVLFFPNNYLLISFLVLCVTMLPFFMVFEKRKPKAREIVLIAMMSALTVVAQMLIYVTLPIQMGTAIVIIAGISLGPESGFLIGALSRFVVNFYIGQGAWTAWQMFCWGLLGFLAGLAFNKVNTEDIKNSRNFKATAAPILSLVAAIALAWVSYLLFPNGETTFFGWRLYAFGLIGLIAGVILQRKRLPVDNLTITLFTFFVTFIVYGGIMNMCTIATVATSSDVGDMSLDTLRAYYISGAPYDAIHAGSAALVMYFCGGTLINKLERVKIKYGIYK